MYFEIYTAYYKIKKQQHAIFMKLTENQKFTNKEVLLNSHIRGLIN